MAVAYTKEIVEDERGFTTAGDDHRFEPPEPSEHPRRRKWSLLGGRRNRHLKALSMPVAPAELHLEETLKEAEKTFHSESGSLEEESSSASTSRSGSGRKRNKTHNALDSTENGPVDSPVSWSHSVCYI